MTHGRATFTRRFKGYEQMPPDVAQRVIAGIAHGCERAAAH